MTVETNIRVAIIGQESENVRKIRGICWRTAKKHAIAAAEVKFKFLFVHTK